MTENISTLDLAQYLETNEDIKQFLNEVSKTGETSDLIHALSIAARAKGMTSVADEAGVTRASLYKSLSETGNPHFDTINRVAHALDCRIVFV